MSSCCGMYQNQPFFDHRLQHHRGAFVAAGVAVGALPVRPDRALVQQRIPHAQLEPVLQQRRLSARIDDDLGANVAAPVAVGNAHAARAIALEQHVDDVHAVERLDAVLARVVEHHLIELASDDLPRLRAFVRLVVPEVERRRQLAAGIDELHAVLLDEVALLHLRQHVEPLQDPVGLRNQRLADVKAWKFLALEEADLEPVLRQQRRRGRPGRAATNHDNVITR